MCYLLVGIRIYALQEPMIVHRLLSLLLEGLRIEALQKPMIVPHHPSTYSYEPIRFLQTSQKRLINIHCKSLKHIDQSALFGFAKNIGHDQI